MEAELRAVQFNDYGGPDVLHVGKLVLIVN
jgi:hypothetical protein